MENTNLSNFNEIPTLVLLSAGVIVIMWPTTLAPSGSFIPFESGTSCMILPVIAFPGQAFKEREAFSRTGRAVPRGIASWANATVENVNRALNKIAFTAFMATPPTISSEPFTRSSFLPSSVQF